MKMQSIHMIFVKYADGSGNQPRNLILTFPVEQIAFP